jgi:hypothetical protein
MKLTKYLLRDGYITGTFVDEGNKRIDITYQPILNNTYYRVFRKVEGEWEKQALTGGQDLDKILEVYNSL